MDFVVHVDGFNFVGGSIEHVTSSGLLSGRVTHVDIEPFSFEGRPFLVDLFVNVGVFSSKIISRESIGWFGDFFVFNVVDSKSSISHHGGLRPISIFGNTS
jgi:hypothetical protein